MKPRLLQIEDKIFRAVSLRLVVEVEVITLFFSANQLCNDCGSWVVSVGVVEKRNNYEGNLNLLWLLQNQTCSILIISHIYITM